MVAMRDGRVVVNQLEVKIPTAYWSSALAQEPHSSRGHGHGRQAGWTAQPFLGATVSDVDTRPVEIDLHSAERSHTVRNHQGADIVSGGTDCLAWLQRSRRCLRVNISDNFGLFATNEFRCFLIRESCTPRFLKAHDIRALALGHLRQTIGEVTISENRQLGFGFDEVRNSGFHARAAGPGNHQRGPIFGSVGHFQQLLNVAHHLNEVWVEVPDDWFRQCFIHSRMNHARPRSEQITSRRLQRRKGFNCKSLLFYCAHSPRFYSGIARYSVGRTISSIPARNVTFEMRCSLIVGTDQANAVKLIVLICSIRVSYQHIHFVQLRASVRVIWANGDPAQSSTQQCGALRGVSQPQPWNQSPPVGHAEFSTALRQKYESSVRECVRPACHLRPELSPCGAPAAQSSNDRCGRSLDPP